MTSHSNVWSDEFYKKIEFIIWLVKNNKLESWSNCMDFKGKNDDEPAESEKTPASL